VLSARLNADAEKSSGTIRRPPQQFQTKQRGTRCDHVILAPGESVTELLLILVIEDEYFAMRDVEAALADGGFATEAVFSGEEALTLFMGSVKKL